MRWFTDSEAQAIEDNLTGYRDSQSLAEFRRIFPLSHPDRTDLSSPDRTDLAAPAHSGFTRTVLALNSAGVDWRDAQWAAGEATCRLPQDSSFETILKTAREILEAYRHAA